MRAKKKERPKRTTPRTQNKYSTILKSLQPETQNYSLLLWLVSNRSITPLEAWEHLGIYRLSGRIHDLRDMGVEISTLRLEVTDRFVGELLELKQGCEGRFESSRG